MSAIGDVLSYKGQREATKQNKKNLKYQKGQVDRAYNTGYEQLAALFGNNGSVNKAFGSAGNTLQEYVGSGLESLLSGYDEAGGIARTGTDTIMNILRGGMAGQIGSLENAYGLAQEDLDSAYGAGIDALNPFAQGGASAYDLYNRTLQGESGAFDQFREGTGYQFLQDEMQRATQRQFAAQGQSGSGNVLAALQDRSAGLASQSFNDYMAQLMGSAQLGAGAAGQQADMYGNLGNIKAGMSSDLGRSIADIIGSSTSQQAGAQQSLMQYLSNLSTDRGAQTSNIMSSLGGALADLETSGAGLEANFRNALMSGGFGVGSTAMSGIPQLGQNLAQSKGAQWAALGNIFSNQEANMQEQLNNFMNMFSSGGGSSMMSMASMFSDARLKDNIQQVGEYGGLGVYSFTPNDKGIELGMDYDVGFLAQEVADLYPEAVHTDVSGYLKVNYAKVKELVEGGSDVYQ